MKKISILIGLFTVSCINYLPMALAQQVVVMGVLDIDFPPYQLIIDRKQTGPVADLLREAFRRLPEYELHYKFLPVKRAFFELERGSIDMTTGFQTPEREKNAYFLEPPLHWSNYKIAVLKGSEFEFNKIKDLYDKDIAMLRGNKISEEFDEAVLLGKIDIHRVSAFEDTVRMLVSNRIDAIVGNLVTVKYYAEKLGFSKEVTFLPHPITPPKAFTLMISKNSKLHSKQVFFKKLGHVFNTMLIDGTFDRVYQEYGLTFDHYSTDK